MMGKTWTADNVLSFNVSANVAYSAHRVNGHVHGKHVLSIDYIIHRKLPCPETIFPDSFAGCSRVGRRLCNICFFWGKVNDISVKCTKCRCYLLPLDQDMADLAIKALKPESPQWDQSVPFDPTSQIGGTITVTQKLRFLQAVGVLSATNHATCSTTLRNPKNQQNQVRALVAVKLGATPLLDGNICDHIRGIIPSMDPVLSDFFDSLTDFARSVFNKKTVGVECHFTTDGLELAMTFRLYLPRGNIVISGRPSGMNEGSQTWACDRAIMAAFLSADSSTSLSSLRLLPYSGKPLPKPVTDANTSSVKAHAKAPKRKLGPKSPALDPIPSGASFSALVSPAVTAAGAAVKSSVGGKYTTPAVSASSSSCSASSATSCETSSSSSSISCAKATPMELAGVSEVETPLEKEEEEDYEENYEEEEDDDEDEEEEEGDGPVFQLLRCSSGDYRVPGGYDVHDTSLSGLLKSMMVDGMKMNVTFPGFTREFNSSSMCIYNDTSERYSKAHGSISGLMQVT